VEGPSLSKTARELLVITKEEALETLDLCIKGFQKTVGDKTTMNSVMPQAV